MSDAISQYEFTKPIIYCHSDRYVIRTWLIQSRGLGILTRSHLLVVTGETMEIAYSELARMLAAKWGREILNQFHQQQWLRLLHKGVERENNQQQQLIGN